MFAIYISVWSVFVVTRQRPGPMDMPPPSDLPHHQNGHESSIANALDDSSLQLEDAASLKVRQKYGLASCSQLPSTSSYKLSQSKSYEEIFMSVDDSMVNFASEGSNKSSRQHGREAAAILAVLQSLARRIIDELVVTGLTMESEHPLLDPLCRMIEISLHHGLRLRWGRKNALWSLLERIPMYSDQPGSASAIENVRQFVSLKTGSARVRAWIMLALMNKCLGSDLELLFQNEQSAVQYTKCMNITLTVH